MRELIPRINELFDKSERVVYDLYTAHAILYNAEGQGEKKLKLHVDDSDVTINFTILADNLEGSELEFVGATPYGNAHCEKHFERQRIAASQQQTVTRLKLSVGECLLHRGSHPHQTTLITKGARIAIIIWLRKVVVVAEEEEKAKEAGGSSALAPGSSAGISYA